MIRETTFHSRGKAPVRTIILLGWLVAIGLAALAALAILDIRQLRDNRDKLAANVAARAVTAGTPETSGSDNTPTLEDIAALSDEITYFNTLTGPRPAPIAHVLEGLEALLPNDVWISQMFYATQPASLTLSLRSENETDLPPALSALEKADFLQNVILERQIRVQQGQRTLVQFDIRAVLR